jgi:hypothetical protein
MTPPTLLFRRTTSRRVIYLSSLAEDKHTHSERLTIPTRAPNIVKQAVTRIDLDGVPESSMSVMAILPPTVLLSSCQLQGFH